MIGRVLDRPCDAEREREGVLPETGRERSRLYQAVQPEFVQLDHQDAAPPAKEREPEAVFWLACMHVCRTYIGSSCRAYWAAASRRTRFLTKKITSPSRTRSWKKKKGRRKMWSPSSLPSLSLTSRTQRSFNWTWKTTKGPSRLKWIPRSTSNWPRWTFRIGSSSNN